MPFHFPPPSGPGRPRLMAVLNLSPDSFYRPSRFPVLDEALRAVERFVEEGADLLDIGAESSRPGAKPIAESLESERLTAVVEAVVKRFPLPVSVDTCKPKVAARVLDQGAVIINDITGLQRHPEMAGIVARQQAGVIIMHMQGAPGDMQKNPHYENLFGEILSFLKKSVTIAEAAGVPAEGIAVDPGIGFGKRVEHNLALIAGLDRFQTLGRAVVLGASRKSFIGETLGLPVEERLPGSLAAAIMGMHKGAAVLRVHDVAATRRALDMTRALLNHESS